MQRAHGAQRRAGIKVGRRTVLRAPSRFAIKSLTMFSCCFNRLARSWWDFELVSNSCLSVVMALSMCLFHEKGHSRSAESTGIEATESESETHPVSPVPKADFDNLASRFE